jgi:death-on-curing protein
MKPHFLTMSEVLTILQDQIRRYGGKYGVRDITLLSSAIAMPESTFGGKYLHKDIYEQAAAYVFHICQNHPFLDGNKRTAIVSALIFLEINGISIDDPNEELYGIMMKVANGKIGKQEIAASFKRLKEPKNKGNK